MNSIRFLLLALFLGSSTAHACYQSENMEGEGYTMRADVTYNSQGSVKVRRTRDGHASQSLFYFTPYEFITGTSLPSYESYLPYAVRVEIESDFDIYIIDFYDSPYLQDKSYAAASAIKKIQELDGFRSSVVLGLSLGGVVARH